MTSKKEETQTVINPPDITDPNYEKGTIALGEKISKGEIPSNIQLDEALEKTKQGIMKQELAHEKRRVGPESAQDKEVKRALDTTYSLLDTGQQFLHEKNQDELLQKLWLEYSQARDELAQRGRELATETKLQVGVNREKWQRQANETALLLRNFILQLFRSQDLRNLFTDVIALAQRLFLRSSPEHQKTQVTGTSSGPSTQTQPTTKGIPPPPPMPTWGKKKAPEQGPSEGTSQAPSQVAGEVRQKTSSLSESEKQTAQKFKQPLQEAWEGKRGFVGAAKETLQRTTDTLRAAAGEMKEGHIEISDQEKKEIQDKLENLFIKICQDYNFQRSLRILMDFTEDMYHHWELVRSQTQTKLQSSPTLQRTFDDTKIFLERFSGGKKLDGFIYHWNRFLEFIYSNQELQSYISDFRGHLEWMLDQPELIETEEFRQSTRDLINRADHVRILFMKNEHLHGLLHEANELLVGFRQDRLTRQLTDRINLWNDNFVVRDPQTGATSLNFELIKRLQGVIVTVLMEHLKCLRLPPVRISDKNQTTTVSGMELTVFEIPPEGIYIRQATDSKLEFKHKTAPDVIAQQTFGYIVITVKRIQSSLRNIHYDFKRHSFPSISDQGILDAFFGGDGMNLRIILDTSHPTERPFFRVRDVSCYIDQLSVKVEESKHETLMRMMTSLFKGRIKRTIQNRIENEVANMFERFEHMLRQAVDQFPSVPGKAKEVISGKPLVGAAAKGSPHTQQRVRT